MCDRCERMEDALNVILQWANAYPLDVFPEPSKEDFHRAHELLKTIGFTLDRFSASMARHTLVGVARIALKALVED